MKRFFFPLIIFLLFPNWANAGTELTVGTDEWPPYEYVEGAAGNDFVTGFSTEVILAVFNKMNIQVKDRISLFPWVRGEIMLLNGELDMLYSAGSNPDRAQIVHYPKESLMETSWSFFIRKKDEGKLKYESFDDLKGKKIGVVRGYYYSPEFLEFIRTEKNFEDVAYDDQNLKKLVHGRLDYIVMDKMNGFYLIKKMGLSDKVVAIKKPLNTVSIYAIFSKETVEKSFVDSFSAALGEFKTSFEYKLIYKKYFSDPSSTANNHRVKAP